MNQNPVSNCDDPFQCPHCGLSTPSDRDVELGAFRVLHLLHHVRQEALNLEDYGEGDPCLGDYCDPERAETWQLAAHELRICIAGQLGDRIEAMCSIAVKLATDGRLGPRPFDWSEQRAALSWARNRMRLWLDERYPQD